jgi:tripartite ATP-independent transporter DctM subunit
MNLAAMFGMLVLLLLLGVPIAYSIGGASIVYFLLKNPLFLLTMPQRIWSGTNNFIIIAMPLFMLAGEIMNKGGLSKRLINFSMLLVKPFGGGLGEVNVVASMIFGGISGSSVADTSALGSILIRSMIEKVYPVGFSPGITVASSTMGMIIPPSVPMLMYAMVSGASVAKLFLAGLIPGLLVGGTQLVLTYMISKKKHYHPEFQKNTRKEILQISKDGMLAVAMPILIVVSISAGIATASESAAIAVLYALILGFLVYRELKILTCSLRSKKRPLCRAPS